MKKKIKKWSWSQAAPRHLPDAHGRVNFCSFRTSPSASKLVRLLLLSRHRLHRARLFVPADPGTEFCFPRFCTFRFLSWDLITGKETRPQRERLKRPRTRLSASYLLPLTWIFWILVFFSLPVDLFLFPCKVIWVFLRGKNLYLLLSFCMMIIIIIVLVPLNCAILYDDS